MHTYELTIGIFIDGNTTGDVEHRVIQAYNLDDAAAQTTRQEWRLFTSEPNKYRELIAIRRIN